jgi:hypothetical protein
VRVDRSLLAVVVLIMSTTLTGFYLSVFVVETDIPIVAGLLGTGGGAMLGSFIAAIATDEPLVGGKTDMAAKRGIGSVPRAAGPPDTPKSEGDASKAL